jgi:hypothetical protein
MANPSELNSYRRRHPNYMILNTNKDFSIGSVQNKNAKEIIQERGGSLLNFGGKMLTSGLGVPGLNPFVTSAANQAGQNQGTYTTSPFINLNDRPGQGVSIPYHDFRTRKLTIGGKDEPFLKKLGKITDNILGRRVDGLSAAGRGSSKAGIMATAAATTGIYTLYNIDSVYGFGTHGAPANRNDFTQKTIGGRSGPFSDLGFGGKVRAIKQRLTPFRGDKVNIIDYGVRSHNEIYQWLPGKNPIGPDQKVRQFIKNATKFIGANPHGTTKDFIKFFFTGPNASVGDPTATDDILVFRAIITSFSDSFSPSWTPVNILGRSDTNYHYSGFSRDADVSFTVYATSRDELKFIYRKLNYLASYTAPEYKNNSISLVAPWLRMTLGDLFVSTPVILNSVSYQFVDADTTWEINFEEDPEMKQVPHKVTVTLGFHVITNELPQKGGAMYSLSDKDTYDKDMRRKQTQSEKDWLNDSKSTRGKSSKQLFGFGRTVDFTKNP